MSAPPEIRVAIVEDDESVSRSLRRLLRAGGIESAVYVSAEAFEADVHRPHFDCLVCDIQMDGMSGTELLESLQASGSSTPVIFVTALDEPEVREQALQAGGAAYLNKSEPGEAILAAIVKAARQSPAPSR